MMMYANNNADLNYIDDVVDQRCPACGDPIDYCQGHGEIGDPYGFEILARHDDGDHSQCAPEGCNEAPIPTD